MPLRIADALMIKAALLILALALQPATRPADPAARREVRVATWNVENWEDHFIADKLKGVKLPPEGEGELLAEAVKLMAERNDEDNWEIARVLLDPQFSPDVLVIQEGPSQEQLDKFNKEWLDGLYETAVVFPGNSTRGQTLGLMLKPGFKLVERRDKFFEMPDPAGTNERGGRLFARGPAFALIESPGGLRLWVGTTHQKSKYGNDVAVTQWRNREAEATRQIMADLRDAGPTKNLVLLGDMNDELGIQSYELEGGGDVITTLAGPPEGGFVLLTRELAESGYCSFMGYWRDRYRSFIDHVVISREATPLVRDVAVFDSPEARLASDHLPVYVDLLPPE